MLAATIAMGILNLTAFVNVNWANSPVVVATLLIVIASYVLLWFFWKGRNWARRLVIFLSVVAVLDLVNLIRPPGNALQYDAGVIAWGFLGLFFIYWLNTMEIRGWFKNPKSPKVGLD